MWVWWVCVIDREDNDMVVKWHWNNGTDSETKDRNDKKGDIMKKNYEKNGLRVVVLILFIIGCTSCKNESVSYDREYWRHRFVIEY